ncbi:MAG TPA: cytochrome P450 [Pyrinomonadaceae bacterium]|nr:cytochrome P450 [Pyrinomonadaceae bacterium]
MLRVSSPPGPKEHALLGHLPDYGKDPLAFLTTCAREYGDVVQLRFPFRTRVYLLNHPTHIEQVLGANSGQFVRHKGMRLRPTQRLLARVNVTYHPANNQFEEFDADRQAFGGLTVQEMLGDWSKYDSRLLGEKDVEGVKTYEIENTLKANESSTIKRFVVLIRADNMLPSEAHVFNAQGSEIRTYRIKEYRTIEGHPTFWRIEIENPVRHTKINLEVSMRVSTSDSTTSYLLVRT